MTCDHSPEDWIDRDCSYRDRVRVVCQCGKFIGYRPHGLNKKKTKRQKQEDREAQKGLGL